MSKLNREEILNTLKTVIDEDTGRDIVSTGMVSSVIIRGGRVGFAVEVDSENPMSKETLRRKCEDIVGKLDGVEKVTAVLTSTKKSFTNSSPPEVITEKSPEKPRPAPLPGIKRIIAVASGKGGVGKSTIAVNIAGALAELGYKTGMVDADIYGPSLHKMLGFTDKHEVNENKRIIPSEKNGIKAVSMGGLVAEGKATVWRGPMVGKALLQLFLGVEWGDIDYMVVDMPPGTGDVQLTLVKNIPINGVVLVSTPQEIALIDVRKAADMFNRVELPIIGIVENMSYFDDKESGNRSYIFGEGGAKKFAEMEGVNFLGEVPLDQSLREACDNGIVAPSPVVTEIAKQIVNSFNT